MDNLPEQENTQENIHDTAPDTTQETTEWLSNDALAEKHPGFKRAFWLLAGWIFFMQMFSLAFMFKSGWTTESLSDTYHLQSEIASIFWFLLLVVVVEVDFRRSGINSMAAYRFEWEPLIKHLPQIVKYFGGCAIFVMLFSLITTQSELYLESKSELTIALTFFTVVVMAPVCEEMAFRGYLYTIMKKAFPRVKERLIVNAMLFSAAHVLLVMFFLGASVPYYIFVIGYLLAKLYEESESIVPCIALHALNNGLVFTLDMIKIHYDYVGIY